MARIPPLLAILALAAALIWVGVYWRPRSPPSDAPQISTAHSEMGSAPAHRPLPLAEPPIGGDFTLVSAQGPVSLAALRGQVVLVYFGYTWCPDICPTNLVFITNALRELTPAELEQVRVLFVSIDPERDTPQRLAEYCAYFHPNVIGLTGTPEALADAARRYGAVYRRSIVTDSAMGYLVDHSASTYVVAPDGRLAYTLDHATPSPRIVGIIRELLATAVPASN